MGVALAWYNMYFKLLSPIMPDHVIYGWFIGEVETRLSRTNNRCIYWSWCCASHVTSQWRGSDPVSGGQLPRGRQLISRANIPVMRPNLLIIPGHSLMFTPARAPALLWPFLCCWAGAGAAWALQSSFHEKCRRLVSPISFKRQNLQWTSKKTKNKKYVAANWTNLSFCPQRIHWILAFSCCCKHLLTSLRIQIALRKGVM